MHTSATLVDIGVRQAGVLIVERSHKYGLGQTRGASPAARPGKRCEHPFHATFREPSDVPQPPRSPSLCASGQVVASEDWSSVCRRLSLDGRGAHLAGRGAGCFGAVDADDQLPRSFAPPAGNAERDELATVAGYTVNVFLSAPAARCRRPGP